MAKSISRTKRAFLGLRVFLGSSLNFSLVLVLAQRLPSYKVAYWGSTR